MVEKRLSSDQVPLVIPGVTDTTDLVKVDALGTADLVLTGINATLPGTAIAFTLPQTKTVYFHGYATVFASTFADIFFDLKVDGVTYPGSSFHTGAPSSPYGPVVVSRSLVLSAGLHTAELVARMTAGAGGTIYTAGGAAPPYICALYTIGTGGSGGGGVGGASALVSQEIETTDPPGTSISTGSATFIPVPSTGMVINLVEEKTVFFEGAASAPPNFLNAGITQLGLRVDGIDYPGTYGGMAVGYYPFAGLSVNKALLLTPGLHTVELIWRWYGSPGGARLSTGSDAPARLTAVYTEPVFGIASLTKQEAENATGTPTTNTTATYALVPGTAIGFTLLTTQVVLFEAMGTVAPVPNGFCAQIGIRIDGIDYDGTGVDWDTIYPIISDTVVAHKAISLAPGPHTAQIVLREPAARGRDAKLTNSATLPTRLTAIYTQPQAIAASPFAHMATKVRTLGQVTYATGGVFIDSPGSDDNPGGPFEITVTTTGGDVLIELYAHGGAHNAGNPAAVGTGLKIDGVEQSGTGTDYLVGHAVGSEIGLGNVSSQGCGQNYADGHIGYMYIANLAPGSHTFRLTLGSSGFAGGLGYMSSNTFSPTRMLVWYN